MGAMGAQAHRVIDMCSMLRPRALGGLLSLGGCAIASSIADPRVLT